MSTLDSDSTLEEMWASYYDNASYEENVSRPEALAFKTACRFLTGKLPITAGRDGQSATRESLREEIGEARAWLNANPDTTGGGSLKVRYGDFGNFRE